MSSILSGSNGLFRERFPQFSRGDFNQQPPTLQPYGASSDIREGAQYVIRHGKPDRRIRVKSYIDKLYYFADEELTILVDTDNYTPSNTDPEPTGTIALGSGGLYAVPGEVIIDTKDRHSAERFGEAIVIINAADDPLNTVAPTYSATGGDTDYGTTLTIATGSWDNLSEGDKRYKHYMDGVEIAGQTATTYVTTISDVEHSFQGFEYPVGRPELGVFTPEVIVITSSDIVIPYTVADEDWGQIEIPPTPAIGNHTIKWGSTFPGGTDLPAHSGWTLFTARSTGGVPNINTAITASNTITGGSGSLTVTTNFAVGTILRRRLGWLHIASGQRFWASNTADTVLINGAYYPYGTILITGEEVTPPSINPLDDVGTPTSGQKNTAVALELLRASTNIGQMVSVYSAHSAATLGIAVLKGDTGAARDRAIQQAKSLVSNPTMFNRGGYGGNVCNPGNFLFYCLKKDENAWDMLDVPTGTPGVTYQRRIDAAIGVEAFSSAFTISDASPKKGCNIVGWGTGGNGNDQRGTATNQILQYPAGALITMCYMGGPAAWYQYLHDWTPAELRAELVTCGLSGSNLHDTMNWASLGRTSPTGLGIGGPSSNAPTDAQIITAVSNNPTWFGCSMTSYHEWWARMVYRRTASSNHTPWLADGNYGDGKFKTNTNVPSGTPVRIGRGWGATATIDGGLNSSGQPVSSGAVLGCLWPTTRANGPGDGGIGAPTELFAWSDESKRSEMHYVIEGMRVCMYSAAVLWIEGLWDKQNAFIQAALPWMDAGTDFTKYADGGWRNFSHGDPGTWPDNNPWNTSLIWAFWNDYIRPALS